MNTTRTPDWDFHCYYPCEIILSHIPVPASRKHQTVAVARRLRVDP